MIHKCKIKSRSNLIQHDVSGGEAHLTGLWEYVQHKKVVIRCPDDMNLFSFIQLNPQHNHDTDVQQISTKKASLHFCRSNTNPLSELLLLSCILWSCTGS